MLLPFSLSSGKLARIESRGLEELHLLEETLPAVGFVLPVKIFGRILARQQLTAFELRYHVMIVQLKHVHLLTIASCVKHLRARAGVIEDEQIAAFPPVVGHCAESVLDETDYHLGLTRVRLDSFSSIEKYEINTPEFITIEFPAGTFQECQPLVNDERMITIVTASSILQVSFEKGNDRKGHRLTDAHRARGSQ